MSTSSQVETSVDDDRRQLDAEKFPSMKKLRVLRERISAELQREAQLLQEEKGEAPLGPVGLRPHSPVVASKKVTRQNQQQSKFKLLAMNSQSQRERGMREMEATLERKQSETANLKVQNERLQQTIQLWQESQERKELKMETELQYLAEMSDAYSTCRFGANNQGLSESMGSLNQMNQRLQEGANELKTSMEKKAEMERLALVRAYRVKIRELQLLLEQQRATDDTARVEKYDALMEDKRKITEAYEGLMSRSEKITQQNEELCLILKHQQEQTRAFTTRIAVVKRENLRLQRQAQSLEEQLNFQEPAADCGGQVSGRLRPLSGLYSHTNSSSKKVRPLSRPASARLPTAPPKDGENDSVYAAAIKRINTALGDMRISLHGVRKAHTQLLQERSELDTFMQQCVEDMRRDIYRFTIASSLNPVHSESKPVVDGYTLQDRRQVLSTMKGRLVTYNTLYQKMFARPATQMKIKKSSKRSSRSSKNSSDRTSDTEVHVRQAENMNQYWDRWFQWSTASFDLKPSVL